MSCCHDSYYMVQQNTFTHNVYCHVKILTEVKAFIHLEDIPIGLEWEGMSFIHFSYKKLHS